jgi:hypothetical protein
LQGPHLLHTAVSNCNQLLLLLLLLWLRALPGLVTHSHTCLVWSHFSHLQC